MSFCHKKHKIEKCEGKEKKNLIECKQVPINILILQSSLVYDIGKGPIKTRFYLRTYFKKKKIHSINVMQTKLGSLKAIRKRS
jgi:hypothetical protein